MVLLVGMAPLYLVILEILRTSAWDAINFYTSFISNVLLFTLMILASHELNFRRALMVFVASSFIVPAVMISPFSDVSDNGRVSALGINANFIAIILSFSFMYLSIAARRQKTILSSLILYLLALIPLFGVISTGTRFGLIVCVFFVCVILYREMASRFSAVLAALITAFTMLAGVFLAVSSNLVIVTRLMQLSETFTTQGRWVLWRLAIDGVGDNYIFGIGPNAFSSYVVPIEGSYMTPHNAFFEFYIYGGLIGIIFCLPILFIAVSGLTRASDIRGRTDLIYFTSVLLIVIFFLHHILFNKIFWFFLAFVYRLCFELKLSYENNNSN